MVLPLTAAAKKATKRIDSEFYVEGYATTFNKPYLLYEFDGVQYFEVIDRNALVGADMSDVIMQYNHEGKVLARQSNKTLGIEADESGLFTFADLSKSRAAQDLYEEINNGFFRSGHNALGLSAGLSGSGMAFDAKWFQQNVQYLQTAGEDKELESMLLQQRIHTVYLNDLPVFDEKTQKKEAISNQRKRWIAAQFGALRASLPHLPKALLQGNIDYCDKIFQWMLPPRLIQLAGVFGLTFVFTVIGLVMSLRNGGNEWTMAIKWWILSVAQVSAMILPVPGGQLFTKEVGKAIMKVPMLAVTCLLYTSPSPRD